MPATAMFRKSTIPIVLVLGLIFIGFGDRFLPQPLSSASYRTRTTINQWMMATMRLWQPKTNPYARTERAIEREEKGK
ncbi:hypothetical protein [Leptothermofonsia sp. ETS-13]|uniref:hypothetical protein n=1 Tax=Leptothermofonsia sp. ETS-13 TaxID=3035696 RepID=UPI003BA0E61C